MSEEPKVKIFTIGKRLFGLGMIVATPGAIEATNNVQRMEMLSRHASGNWGLVCKDDAVLNKEALQTGDRLLSAYPIDPALPCKGFGENTLWIIMESDRSVTTFLLPDEY